MSTLQAVSINLLLEILGVLINPSVAIQSDRAAVAPILSEVMADPTFVSDAQGEFLELANPTSDTLRLDSLGIVVDGQNLVIKPFLLVPEGFLLLCRDSSFSSNGGMVCQRQWTSLALANSRNDTVLLNWETGQEKYVLPIAKPGVSWENTGEKTESYHRFLSSGTAWAGEDSATPGFHNSRSVAPPRFDLGITQVTVGAAGVLSIVVRDLGTLPFDLSHTNLAHTNLAPTYLVLRMDRDWDGDWETLLDSQAVTALPAGGTAFIIPLGPGLTGLIQARLGRDDNPVNNTFSLSVGSTHALVLNEWCPAPESGSPEWVEIRNATLDSSGQGRTLSLGQVAFKGKMLGSKAGNLAPGEILILTEDAARFRSHYGAIKVRILELSAWPGLRNTGDTLSLSVLSEPVDSVVYTSGNLVGSGACLVRGESEWSTGSGTPGFTEATISEFSWELGTRIASAGQPLDVDVRAPAGFNYSVRVFDLEGNCVRALSEGGSGHHIYHWSGEDSHGGMLRPGPYLICLSSDGHRTRKRAVAVAGNR